MEWRFLNIAAVLMYVTLISSYPVLNTNQQQYGFGNEEKKDQEGVNITNSKVPYLAETYKIPMDILSSLSKHANIPGEVDDGIVSLAGRTKSPDNLNKLLNVLFAKVLENPQGFLDSVLSFDEANPKTSLQMETDIVAGYKGDRTKGTKIDFHHNLFESADKKERVDLGLKTEILLVNGTNYQVSDNTGVNLQYQLFF